MTLDQLVESAVRSATRSRRHTFVLLEDGPRFGGLAISLGPCAFDDLPYDLYIPHAWHDCPPSEIRAYDRPPSSGGPFDRYRLTTRRQTNSLRDYYGAWIYQWKPSSAATAG